MLNLDGMPLNPEARPFLPRSPIYVLSSLWEEAQQCSSYYYYHGFLCPPPPQCRDAVGFFFCNVEAKTPVQEEDSATDSGGKAPASGKRGGFFRKVRCRNWKRVERSVGEDDEVDETPGHGTDNEKLIGGNTTVMIKNIPNRIKREDLVQLLEQHCDEENQKAHLRSDPMVVSAFDFVYLPMDFRSGSNLGYAFVNLTSNEGALRLCRRFNNYRWRIHNTKKICRVISAKIQGKEALERHFRNSNFCCDSDEFLPVAYSPPRSGPGPAPAPTGPSSSSAGATLVGKCVGYSSSSLRKK